MPKFNLRFSLQTLLVVTLVVGVWMGVTVNRARRQREAVTWVMKQGGHISYDYERPTADGSYPVGAKPPGPEWLRERLGIEYFASVEGVILDRDEISDISPLAKLPRLRFLGLINYVDPRTDFSPLFSHQQLRMIHLDYTGLDPEHLKPLKAALPNCKIESATDPDLCTPPEPDEN